MPKSVNAISPHKESLYQYLSSGGDGTGTVNAKVDFDAAPDIFYIQPPPGKIYYLNRMMISIGDETGMRVTDYGNITGALANGITFKVVDDGGTLIDLTDGIPITTNASYGSYCYDVDVKAWGAGNELLVVRWTFAKAGYPIRLDGSRNERFEANFSDDLSTLLTHYFLMEGWVD